MASSAPRMWVHRLSVDESGSPQAAVQLEEIEDHLMDVAKAVMRNPEDLADQPREARAFLLSELFDHGILRQGWGAPGMSVTRRGDFLKNHVIAMWRYWRSIPVSVRDELRKEGGDYSRLFSILQPYYREAAGRHTIIDRMNAMGHGNIVFLPNVPEPGVTFTVARIKDHKYTFEEPPRGDRTAVWHFDFGHRRDVTDVKTFKYSPDTLERGAFGAPYLHAIDPVSSARVEELQSFVERHYGA